MQNPKVASLNDNHGGVGLAYAQFLGEVVKFQSWQMVLNYGAAPMMERDRPKFQQVVRFALSYSASVSSGASFV